MFVLLSVHINYSKMAWFCSYWYTAIRDKFYNLPRSYLLYLMIKNINFLFVRSVSLNNIIHFFKFADAKSMDYAGNS